MGELIVLATVLAGGITQLVTALKATAFAKGFTESIWLVLACAFGIAGAFFLDVDVSVLPVNGPDELARVVVGLFAGLISAGFYEGKQVLRATRKR
jgi:hypothetical protein